MADDELDFEDRFADVPVEEDDAATAAKKAELLKLAVPPAPVMPETVVPKTSGQITIQGPTAPVPTGRPVAPTGRELTDLLVSAPTAPPQFGPVDEPVPLIDVPETAQVRVPQTKIEPPSKPSQLAKLNPEVEAAIQAAAKAYGLDPNMLRGIASIESNFDPMANVNRGTQYKGLYQIGAKGKYSEWATHGKGDIYNAADNAMAAAKIARENIEWFKGKFGREPTPAEIYLMHQQGPGFFSKGIMTNIKGNLPAGARIPENMTHEGFRRWWENKLAERTNKWMGGGMQQPPEMLSPTPVADQLLKMRGGGVATPQERALVQGMIAPKSIAQQPMQPPVDVSRVPEGEKLVPVIRKDVSKAYRPVSGPNLPTGIPQSDITLPSPALNFKQDPLQTIIQNPSVASTISAWIAQQPGEQNYVPVPAPGLMDQARKLAAQSATAGEDTPGIGVLFNPGGPAVANFYGALADTVKGYLARAYDIPDMTQPDNWTADNGMKLIQMGTDAMRGASRADQAFTKGAVQGVWQSATGLPLGLAAMATGLGYKLTGSETLGQGFNLTQDLMKKSQDYGEQISGELKPDESFEIFSGGKTFGQVIGPNKAWVAQNLVGQAIGPGIFQYLYANGPNIPNIMPITPADGKDLSNYKGVNQITYDQNGNRIVATTPAGKMTVDARMANAMGLFGLGTLGFMFAPGVLRGMWQAGAPTPGNLAWQSELANAPKSPLFGIPERVARNPITGNLNDGLLMAKGSPFDWPGGAPFQLNTLPAWVLSGGRVGAKNFRNVQGDLQGPPLIRSNALDYLKSQVLSSKSPMTDVLERWVRMTNGADPKAAARVIDLTHIYSNTGMRNVVTSALNTGKAQTRQLRFDVAKSMTDLKKFAAENPDFTEYMTHVFRQENLAWNAQKWQGLAPTTAAQRAKANATYPPDLLDRFGTTWDAQDTATRIRNMETMNPNLAQGRAWFRNYVNETRRFMVEGTTAPENRQKMMDHGMYGPTNPTFNTNNPLNDVWQEVKAGQDPLHVLERNVGQAMITRMEHELNWSYIRAMPPNTHFREVDDAFIKRHSIDQEAIYNIKNDGKNFQYMADPFIISLMRMDPAGYASALDRGFGWFKRQFQAGTTGPFAPHFSVIANARSFEQQIVSAPPWAKPVINPLTNLTAIPRAWTGTQAAFYKPYIDNVATWLKNGGYGALVGGDQNVDLIARILTAEHAKAFNRTMERAGGKNPDWLDNTTAYDRQRFINNARRVSPNALVQKYFDFLQKSWKVYDASLGNAWRWGKEKTRNVADASVYQWEYKNRNTIDPVTGRTIRPEKLAAEGRRLTGDPAERGYGGWTEPGSTKSKRLPFQVDNPWDLFGVRAARGVGFLSDFGHQIIPWSGTLVRSPAATFTAMANNPYRSAIALTATQIMPEAVAYYMAWALGPDYVNYKMEGRSENTRRNYIYLPVPGRAPEQGIEIPDFQEGSPVRLSALAIFDQMMARSSYTPREDAWDMVTSVLQTMVEPPVPSPLSAGLGYFGVTAPEGWTGDAFKPHPPGYQDINAADNVYERLLRSVSPAIADYWTQVFGAYHASPSMLSGVGAAGKALGYREIQRMPFVRDAFNIHPTVAGSTRITEDMYKKQKAINALSEYNAKEVKNKGMVNTKGRSAGGMELSRQNLDPRIQLPMGKTAPLPGLPDTDFKNPLFKVTKDMIEQLFIKDSPQKGSIGYLSMWSNYGIYSRYINSMRKVNDGNPGAWMEKFHSKNKAEVSRLDKLGIDTNNYREVKNYYLYSRDRVAKEILLYVKAGEQKIDQLPKVREMLGPDKHFTIEMADPYDTTYGDLSKMNKPSQNP